MSNICSFCANNCFINVLLLFQFVILVVDSTDRERLTLTKDELHRMLAHEVQVRKSDIACVVLRDVR